jgi:hypothetical protein
MRPISGNSARRSTEAPILSPILAAASGFSAAIKSIWFSRSRSAVRSHLTGIPGAGSPFGENRFDLRVGGKIAGIGLGKSLSDALYLNEILDCSLDNP